MKSLRFGLCSGWAILLLTLPLLAAGPKQQQSPKDTATLGISVGLPDGSSEVVPVQKKVSTVIPTPGAKGVFGVQLEPYMSGRSVAVHVKAVTGGEWKESQGPSFQSGRKLKTRKLGSYVIGSEGDIIQLGDLAEFGLPSVTLKVVAATAAEKSCAQGGDPCILCDNGLICCWTNPTQHQECLNACGGGLRERLDKK